MSGSQDSFGHLHEHTEYSMLDGAARLTQLTERAAELGGSCTVTAVEPAGTRVWARLPITSSGRTPVLVTTGEVADER